MVTLNSDEAKKNSGLLVKMALERKNVCLFNSSSIDLRQTSERFVPKSPSWASEPKAEIQKPKICKPQF